MAKAKVSVIVPVYNAERYLAQCLDSIISQTLSDIEIICVNDGSTDSSPDILRQYQDRDSRITIIEQQNQFAGVARNSGMEHAAGDYLVFWDADDYFEPQALEAMYRQITQYGADICLCGANYYNIVSNELKQINKILNTGIIPHQPFSAKDVSDIYQVTTAVPWSKMFSASFIRQKDLKFQAIARCNDVYFVYSALALAEKIVYVDQYLVNYRTGQTTNLQSGTMQTPLLFTEALQAIKDRLADEPCWEYVKSSFISYGVRIIENYTTKRLKDYPEAKSTLIEEICRKGFSEFGMTDFPVCPNYDHAVFSRLMRELLKETVRENKKAASLQKTADAQKREMAMLNQQIADQTEASGKLREEMDKQTREFKKLRKKLDGQIQENDKLHSWMDERAQENEKLHKMLDGQSQEAAKLHKALDDQNRETAKLHKTLDDQNQETVKLHKMLDDQAQEAAKLHKTLDDQNRETAKLHKTIDKQVQETEKLNNRLDKQAQAAEKLQKEKDALLRKCNKLENEKQRMRASFSYRMGRAITWLPRKIRSPFRR